MPASSLKTELTRRLRIGERLTQLSPRRYSLHGWWSPDKNWPLPNGAAVIEAKRGYRHGPENVTLAWALQKRKAQHVIDFGSGSGSLTLMAAYLLRPETLVSLELQSEMCERLRRTLNAFMQIDASSVECISIVEGDLRDSDTLTQVSTLLPDRADAIIFNPPFFPCGWGRQSSTDEVHRSTHSLYGDVTDFLKASRLLLSEDGWVCILYDALRLHDLLPALALTGFTLQEIRYTPDHRPNKREVPFRVWCFCGLQDGAKVYGLESSASIASHDDAR